MKIIAKQNLFFVNTSIIDPGLKCTHFKLLNMFIM